MSITYILYPNKSIANDPNTPERAPIIPQAPERSRPPKLPAVLQSIFAFAPARPSGKTLSSEQLHTPPPLPERAINSNSTEARLLGPFSLRRTSNIHRRFLRDEMSRLLPPLEVPHASTSTSIIPPVAFEGTNARRQLEEWASPPPPLLPRRQRLRLAHSGVLHHSKHPDPTPEITSNDISGPHYLPRPVRRSLGNILGRLPILKLGTSAPSPKASRKNKPPQPRAMQRAVKHAANSFEPLSVQSPDRGTASTQMKWTASLSPRAITKKTGMTMNSRDMSDEDRAWIMGR